jgi:hypothetical protein
MVPFLTQLLLAIRWRFTKRARLEAENLILRQQLEVPWRKFPTLVSRNFRFETRCKLAQDQAAIHAGNKDSALMQAMRQHREGADKFPQRTKFRHRHGAPA